ncbi:MAG: hypothetical protein WA309_02110, partial [Pseudolabrys sp.]
ALPPKADMAYCSANVRFRGNSRHHQERTYLKNSFDHDSFRRRDDHHRDPVGQAAELIALD